MRTIILTLFSLVFALQAQAQIEVVANVTDASCYGKQDGVIDIQMRNGVPPYTFEWMPGGQTTEDLFNIPAGNYLVFVKDANGLTGSKEIEVSQPSPLVVEIDAMKSVLCPDERTSLIATVQGGVGSYTYRWNNPGQSTTPKIDQVASGNYTLTVKDTKACELQKSISVGASNPKINLLHKSDESCSGMEDGSIAVSASGGRSPYVFSWSNSKIGSQLFDLSPASYTVTLTDHVGCVKTSTISINPSTKTLIHGQDFHVDFTPVHCFNAANATFSVNLDHSSSLADLTIRWQDPAGRTGYVKNDVLLENLSAGSYHLTVTNDQCLVYETFVIPQPEKIEVNYHVVQGAVEGTVDVIVLASGGSGTFLFSKDGGQTYADNNVFSGIVTGETYAFVIKDSNNCLYEEGGFKIDESVNDPNAIHIIESQDPLLETYPNPTTGTFMISFRNKEKEDVRVRVISMMGNAVFDQLVTSKVNHLWLEVDLSSQPKGIYVVTLESRSTSYKERVVLQ